MQKYDLAKLLRLMLLLLTENIIKKIKPTAGTENKSDNPKYDHAPIGLYFSGNFDISSFSKLFIKPSLFIIVIFVAIYVKQKRIN